MAGAMLIAFTIIFVIESLQNLPTGMDLVRKIFMIPVNAIGGWFNGIRFLAVIFVVLSRLSHFSINLEEDWSVDKLKDIPVSEKTESRAEAFISIGFLTILIVVMNLYPEIVTLCENTFARSGLPLGHRVELEVFRKYVGILTIFWIVGIISRVLTL